MFVRKYMQIILHIKNAIQTDAQIISVIWIETIKDKMLRCILLLMFIK